jgi:hypothetical protein
MRKTQKKKKSRAGRRKSETNRDGERMYARALNEEHFGARVLDWDYLISADGRHKRIKVNTRFGFFAFDYDRDELRKQVALFLKKEMKSRTVHKFYKNNRGGIDSYNEEAFDLFEQRIVSKMEALPYKLVQQIFFALVSKLEANEVLASTEKSAHRKLWDSLGHFYARSLKEEWADLKPGPSTVTSENERTAMLKFYNAILPVCQSAKSIYKRNRKSDWRDVILKKHPDLGREDVEDLIRMKPSDVAHLITGKRFKRIIGKDLQGEAETRRQLGVARAEAREARARARESDELEWTSWESDEYFSGE